MSTKLMRDASYLLPDPGGEVVRQLLDEVDRLKTENQQAHRQGWEQCKKAAIVKTMEHHQDYIFGSSIPTVCRDIAYAIAAMEYKDAACLEVARKEIGNGLDTGNSNSVVSS